MKKFCACLVFSLIIPNVLIGQQVPIPDPHFLSALIESGVDIDGSGTVEPGEAAMVDHLDISDKNIHDLSGIGAFTALTELDCSSNYLIELELLGNSHLETLCCAANRLNSLDLSGNPALTDLICCFNLLTSVNLSCNPALRFLDCSANRLVSVDVSGNPLLEYLSCGFNYLWYLELSINHSLTHLDCPGNGIRNLDLSENGELHSLSCSFNQLTSLNISQNPSLEKLYCGYNRLKELDITANTNIKELDISGMKMLTTLFVSALPFPPEGMNYYSVDSPHIKIKDCQPPRLDFSYLQNDPLLIEVCLSEDGFIYVVTQGTGKDSTLISEACLRTAKMTARISRKIPLVGLNQESFWIYAIDAAGNISGPFTVRPQWTGIGKNPDDRIIIHPNPAGDFVNIVSYFPGRTTVRLTSMNAVVFTEIVMESGTFQLDLSTLPSGTYLITLMSPQSITTRKIIKY
jgi:hypothetical protein